ncbi:MAG: hypothetical protein AUI95_02425 [Crenarchaeota archaeon 13_1_40CM_3_52_4]|nr:MAG: hypothetical protein AUI95_02425 [Crenarchaeota archaeon 13_1_40CM_3_52_4]
MRPYHSFPSGPPSEKDVPKMPPRPPTTRIGVKRIVIEVNRDLTVEQLEILDDALKRAGLVKETKVTFHNREPHKARTPRVSHPTWRIGRDSQSSSLSTH